MLQRLSRIPIRRFPLLKNLSVNLMKPLPSRGGIRDFSWIPFSGSNSRAPEPRNRCRGPSLLNVGLPSDILGSGSFWDLKPRNK
jgi:hypothetical protein